MNFLLKKAFCLLTILAILLSVGGASAAMKTYSLPESAGAWHRPESPGVITATNIFQYMNGAGELYISYRFDHMDVYEYTADGLSEIVAEVYVMKTPADAFGLLSMDWGGEPVRFDAPESGQLPQGIAPPHRALYGGGLLRMCVDNLYLRVMTFDETPQSTAAVLSIGRVVAANRPETAEPGLLKILPGKIGQGWDLRKDRIGFFRSHLVLNSFFYLSHQNILGLDHSTEAVTAAYERSVAAAAPQRVQFLYIRYADAASARQGLDQFHEAYILEHPLAEKAGSVPETADFYKVEDGWLGLKLTGRSLSLVFNCPDRESAKQIIHAVPGKGAAKE